jgi:CheY-like chemotaxis protein
MNKSSNNNRILIVEDDAIVASQLQRTLTKMGYTSIGPVANGEEAIELALRDYPDAILMDIKLKGELTGIEAADIIHKESEIPVIYLTAYADHETIERSKDGHTYGFLTKPVRDKELGAMIETALYKSSTDRSLKHVNQLLRAIRSIDKLITKESVPEKLLSEACKILVNSKDYVVTWISNETDPASNPMIFSEKFKKSFSGGITNHFLKKRVQNVLNIDLPTDKPTVLREKSISTDFPNAISGKILWLSRSIFRPPLFI